MPAAGRAIEVRALAKSFETAGGERLTVLDGLSFPVEAGGITSILGPSGCGKTTLLRIIAGVEKPDRGEVIIPGGAALSLVHQQDDLLPWLTLEGNIRLAMQGGGAGRKAREAGAKEHLERVGLGDFRTFYPSQISVGMQKRVSLARALAADADVILCDEPLASLDFQNRLRLQDLMVDLFLEGGKTIVYVTHDIYEAVRLSRRTLLLTALPGRIKSAIDIPFPYPRNLDDPEISVEGGEIVSLMKRALMEEVPRTDETERRRILQGRP